MIQYNSNRIAGTLINDKDEISQFYSNILPPTTNALVTYSITSLPEITSWTVSGKPKIATIKKFTDYVTTNVPLVAALAFGSMKPLKVKEAIEIAKTQKYLFTGDDLELWPYDCMHIVQNQFDILLTVYEHLGRAGVNRFFDNDPIYWAPLSELLKRGEAGRLRVVYPPPGHVCLATNENLASAWTNVCKTYLAGNNPAPVPEFVQMDIQSADGTPYFAVKQLFPPSSSSSSPPPFSPLPFESWQFRPYDDSVPQDALILEPSIEAHAAHAPGGDGIAVFDARLLVRVAFRNGNIELADLLGLNRRVLMPHTLVHPSRFAVSSRIPVQLAGQAPSPRHVVLYAGGAPFDVTWTKSQIESAAALAPDPTTLYLQNGTKEDIIKLMQ